MPMVGHAPPLDPDVDAAAQLARRLRIATTLCIGPILLFAAFDVGLVPTEELWIYWAIKLAALVVIAVAVVFLRQRAASTRPRLVAIGLICVGALYGLSTTSAVLAGETQTSGIIALAVALATATLLPWGVVAQLAVVALGIVSTTLAVYGAHGSLAGLVQYPTVGLVIGMGVSVFVAFEFERTRIALTRRQAEHQRADAEVRRLNAELEARVGERTAELERVNRDLQREIEERIRYAAELRQSQAAASALIENADDAIWAIDREQRLVIRNAAVRRRYAEAIGAQLTTKDEYPDAVRRELQTYWEPLYVRGLAGERFVDEQIVDTGDGRRYFVNAFNPIVIDGAVAGLAVFSSEVTELRRSEEAARQRQAELTHVQRLSTLGEMAAGLAHEINQPLSAIVNYARGCARRLRADPASLPAVMPALDSISTEALRAGEVIRRLRQLVRKETLRQEAIDLNALVAEVARIVGPEAKQAGVEIEEFPGAALPLVMGDSIQIEQVILNLIRNAMEAMSGGGPRRMLQVTTRVSRAGYVEVAVRDTGPGLPEAMADLVFEPFFSTKPNGLGMGLSISRTIIQSHHGRLWAEVNEGGGTTFRVELPTPGAGRDDVVSVSATGYAASHAER